MRKVFLKLDGIGGEAQCARHAGEIEISSFYWGSSKRSRAAAIALRGGSKDLTIIKRTDKTSPYFGAAAASRQSFEGIITLEDYSAKGAVVRAVSFEMRSVSVDSVTRIAAGEMIALSCESIKLKTPSKGKSKDEKKDKEVKIMKRNLVIISIFLVALALCAMNVAAQFTAKMPEMKINKPVTYHRPVVPLVLTGTTGKCGAAACRTDVFFGNPLNGFAIQ